MPLCPPRALPLTGSLAQAWASFVVFSTEKVGAGMTQVTIPPE